MQYLSWNEEKIQDFSATNIEEMYERGFVFTRLGKGIMQQTRSFRIDLDKFILSSENRRILKKVPDLQISFNNLPLENYNYSIGKLAKDFYEIKFGQNIMSAQKVKEMLTDGEKSNFNTLISFGDVTHPGLGYTIAYVSPSIIHYSYPFYDLDHSPKDIGLAMMIKTLERAKAKGIKYVYLGSLQRPSDTYKLQFSNGQWFDGKKWNDNIDEVKLILKELENDSSK